jgi:CBS-domain-containing membrane protein
MRKPYHLSELQQRFGAVPVQSVYTVINGFISLGLLGLTAHLAHEPYLFPSLGPTALILFVTPKAEVAAPRNVVLGHLIGVLCGYGALLVTGLTLAPPAFLVGVTGARVICAALALSFTGGLTVLFKCQHPPAGATTLIIALGIMTKPYVLLVLMEAVVILVLQAIGINRLAGIDYPLWRQKAAAGR